MKQLHNKKILVGITGSIAAYKSIELISMLRKQGAEVRVVLTKSAKEFVTPLTLQTLSGNPIYSELFQQECEPNIEHIELARWPDLIIIAPATANFVAKLANAFADDLLTTICNATTAKIILAPAMNQQMWRNPLTQNNVTHLLNHNFEFWGPALGEQACGEFGFGRMLEPEVLLQKIIDKFNNKNFPYKVLITAGPTREAIDPVRFISNYSSGKMGYAIAAAAAQEGAEVILISGPTNLSPHPQITDYIAVNSAQEMHAAALPYASKCDIFIATAAVADYCPENIAENKIKKSQETLVLNLKRNPDILASIAALPTPPFTVGFAAETDNVIEHAKMKLQNKNLAMIVANRVGFKLGFECDQNSLTIITKDQRIIELPQADKTELATQLLKIIQQELTNSQITHHV